MEKTCGIIAEYNPFHNGHAHQIAEARKVSQARNIVVVMSGNFVQRGEPAIINKFARTRQALENGADVVLELPVGFATASAEGFAHGAVDILATSGIVDSICFGAESPDISALWDVAKFLINEGPEFKKILRENLAKGDSFPKAREKALKLAFAEGAAEIVKNPNNILGVEYLKAILRLDAKITPYAIARKGAAHHGKELVPPFASASALRGQIHTGNVGGLADFMPLSAYDILRQEYLQSRINNADNLSPHFHYALAAKKSPCVFDDAAKKHYAISKVVAAAKTKNVTHSALSRAAIHILLGLDEMPKNPQYIRVLGFRREKEHLLRALHKNAALPVITNAKHAKNALAQEIFASKVYWLGLKHKNIPDMNEISTPMVMI